MNNGTKVDQLRDAAFDTVWEALRLTMSSGDVVEVPHRDNIMIPHGEPAYILVVTASTHFRCLFVDQIASVAVEPKTKAK